MRKTYFVFIMFFIFFTPAFAQTAVTRVEQENGRYSVTLNNALKVSGISLKEKNGVFDTVFPVYASKGKIYAQFGILNRDFRKRLVKSLRETNVSQEEFDTVFVINKLSLYRKKGHLKAFASVIFNDDIEVECRIMDGKNGLWIAWPSNKNGEKWRSNFEITDRKIKNGVESLLIEEYTKKLNNEN